MAGRVLTAMRLGDCALPLATDELDSLRPPCPAVV
jgi:hypothetical protein